MPVIISGGTTGGNATSFTGGTGNASISGTSGVILPTWTTATRPASPSIGTQGWNSDVGYEIWTGSAWAKIMAKG
jgi:hypothetical protein